MGGVYREAERTQCTPPQRLILMVFVILSDQRCELKCFIATGGSDFLFFSCAAWTSVAERAAAQHVVEKM